MDPPSPHEPLLHPCLRDAVSLTHSQPSESVASFGLPQSATVQNLPGQGLHVHSSRTWTTSSGELGLLSDTDEIDDRDAFIVKYNALATKVCLVEAIN